MSSSSLYAVTPLDGRYAGRTAALNPLVSEAGLIHFRIRVEAAWLLHLAAHKTIGKDLVLNADLKKELENLAVGTIPDNAATKVKEIEATTNHDVKAVEYYLRERLAEFGADDKVNAFIHFACTSEDINNLSYGLMLKETRDQVIVPGMDEIISTLETLSKEFASVAMMSRTHGQTASPSTVGKEFKVFVYRLNRQKDQLMSQRIDGKISGAVGNYNAHVVAYPEVDWVELAVDFVESRLGLNHNPLTTQIENHDGFVEYCDVVRRYNTVAIDLARDIWGYISLGYFKQKLKEGEVGSSTMPHKVNPIDFENAEGNYGLSSALSDHFATKLPISRWQRDLSDSTVLRAFGVFAGHHVLAQKALLKGLGKLEINPEKVAADLTDAWEVLGEAVQTVMRRYGVVDAYERLKAATRGQAVTKEAIADVINTCGEIPTSEKDRLLQMTPSDYTGIAASLVN
ncbi:adenylosuccinate lyase [bacterium]|nr:adenylosuccinate lyase [bacterium]